METPLKIYIRFVKLDDEVIAVFMYSSANRRYDGKRWVRMCYAHMGQHSECYNNITHRKRASKEEYEPLLKELKAIGYENIIICQ